MRWPRTHFAAILQATSTISRQRTGLFRPVLDAWGRLLRDAAAVEEGHPPHASLPVSNSDAGYLRQLVWKEIQCILASNVASDWHAELVELLEKVGAKGFLEDLATQAKYQQLCSVLQLSGDGKNEPPLKKPRRDVVRVWAGDNDGALAGEEAFDGDSLLSGEAEFACRRFEDYFGLPSQREPGGHVSGPALLASRVGRDRDLARLAITSLGSLSEKRALVRDRAQEKVVAILDNAKNHKNAKGAGAGKGAAGGDGQDVAPFLAKEPSPPPEAEVGRDPRGEAPAKPRDTSALTDGNAEAAWDHEDLLPAEGDSIKLPADPAGKDNLQMQLFEEVLEAERRMENSPFSGGLSQAQLDTFSFVNRQVALHIAAGTKASVGPSLQRAMCQRFVVRALDALKAATPDKTAAPGSTTAAAAPLGQLVEVFYAKFAADAAKVQEVPGNAVKLPGTGPNTPLRLALEASKPGGNSFSYAELFQFFAAEFDKRELPRRDLRGFLNEIPYIPASAFRMLEAQCQQGSARKMALLTVLSLIESRPACRWDALRLLFRLAYLGGEDSSVRFDTIRLIINKIYSAGPHHPERWQLPHLTEAEATALLNEGASATTKDSDSQDDEFVPLQKLKGRCVEGVATLMLRSMTPASAKFSFAVQVPKRVEELCGELFKGALCAPKDRVWLYLALCIKRPVLVHELVETFTQCDEDMKEHLINSIEEAIKYIPASEPELLVLVQKANPNTERLVLKVLHILMQTSQGKEGLSAAYGQAVTRLYGVTKNPRLLVPVFDLLERSSLLDFLPAVLNLESEQVTDAFQQLVRARSPPLSISELLTELHHMNKPGENIVPIKSSMQALNIIFGMRDQFDPKVYGIVIQALVEERGLLPTLFMRTVIQVVKELPRLSDFIVMEILPRLVRQEVWSDENMWRGFMIVLQHTFASQSGGAARVLAMLPTSQLEDVLVQHPDWKAQLREFVARQPPGAAPQHVRQLLQ